MSMSTWVYGFKPPDEKWRRMKAVYDACSLAGTDLPKEVDKFFQGQIPDAAGVEVSLVDTACCQEYIEEMKSGFEIDLTKLPKDIRIIRFVNSF